MSSTRPALRLHLALALVFAAVCAVGAGTGAWGSEGGPTSASAPRHGGSGDALGRSGEVAGSRSGDRWAADYTAEQFAAYSEELDGHYIGVGLWLARSAQGVVTVTRTLPGSPAAQARLADGDQLLAVDGTRVDGRPVTQVVALLRGGADGRVGSAVTLLLQRGAQQWSVALRRVVLDENDVRVDHPEEGVTRISMDAFTVGVSEQVQAAVRQARLQPAHGGRGILLDLRGNSGGLVAEAVATVSVFLDGGVVARYRPAGGAEQTLTAAPGGDTTTPLVVLVDSGTMSAAELVTGALRDRGRAVVVGRPTFGKGAVQEPEALSDGIVQEHTVGHYLTPSGVSPEGQGIAPDIVVPPTAGPQAAEATALTVLDDLSGGDGQ